MNDWVPILTHYPGKIMSFNATKQTATVKVMREQYNNTLHSMYTEYDFPILQDVPVQFPQGGGYCLTFPVNPGDNCILDFCDKGISHWLYEGADKIGKYESGIPKADYFRSYNINDAVCCVGYNPIPQAIPDFNPTAPELRNTARTQRITLLPSGIMEILTPSQLHITAPETVIDGNTTINGNTTMNGNLHVTGTIVCDTQVTVGTVNLTGHTHSGVQTGPGITGAPNA